jgi:hypothetical protein
MEAPDPVDLVRFQERNDGLNLLLGEKEKRIIELTQYKEDIGTFANYFKSKAPEMIEAPAAEKKSHGISFGNLHKDIYQKQIFYSEILNIHIKPF